MLIVSLLLSAYAILKVDNLTKFIIKKEDFSPYQLSFHINWNKVFQDFYGMKKKEIEQFYNDLESFLRKEKRPSLESFLMGSVRLTILDYNSTQNNFLYYWNDANSFMKDLEFFQEDFSDLPNEFKKYPFYEPEGSLSTSRFGIYWGNNEIINPRNNAYRFFITTKESYKRGIEKASLLYVPYLTNHNVCVIPKEFMCHPYYANSVSDPEIFYKELGWKYNEVNCGNFSIENDYLTVRVHYL